MRLPGPDHPITITPNPKRVRVSIDGVVIADTTHALTLKEASYPAVQYVPRTDANLTLMSRTDRVTHCPYKGDAALLPAAKPSRMRSGLMKCRFRRWLISPGAWPSTRIRSRSRKWPERRCERLPGPDNRKSPLDPEDREAQDQQHQEDHHENIEQEAGDIRRCSRYPGEAEDSGDDRHHEKDQRPFQNRHRRYSSFGPLRSLAPHETHDVTSRNGTCSRPGGSLFAGSPDVSAAVSPRRLRAGHVIGDCSVCQVMDGVFNAAGERSRTQRFLCPFAKHPLCSARIRTC